MDTTTRQCDHCYTTLHGDFCHRCGQEKKSYIRNVTGVVTEFFGEFSNWDTRLWRTLLPLWFRPGYLSRRYVQGHRVPYVPPLRLYLFTSIIAFLILAKLVPDPAAGSNEEVKNVKVIYAETTESEPQNKMELFTNSETEMAEDIPLTQRDVKGNHQYTLDMPFLSDAAQHRVNQRFTAFIENPKLAVNKFFSLAPQMMLLLLPLFALLLKVMYIRSDRFYMEHLILALHSHSFILQVGVFYLLLGALQSSISWFWLASLVGWIETAFLYWIPVYLFLCQKFYYQQGWGKTVLKFWLTSSLYNVLFLFAFTGLILLSVLWM